MNSFLMSDVEEFTYQEIAAIVESPIGTVMSRICRGRALLRERLDAREALDIGLVTEVVERSALWDRAHEIAATIAAKPSIATQGTVRAIWESLDKPYRAAMDQGLIYTRLGNPIGSAQVDRANMPPITPRTARVHGTVSSPRRARSSSAPCRAHRAMARLTNSR